MRVDSPDVDDITDLERPAHGTLVGAGIPIVEHLCGIAGLPIRDFRFSAVLAKIKGMGPVPTRVLVAPNAVHSESSS